MSGLSRKRKIKGEQFTSKLFTYVRLVIFGLGFQSLNKKSIFQFAFSLSDFSDDFYFLGIDQPTETANVLRLQYVLTRKFDFLFCDFIA